MVDIAGAPAPERRFWWVNHKQTFKQEVEGGYLWSPLTNKNGGRNEFYENMKRVRPGDIVVSFANAAIQAVGVCTSPAIFAPKPHEFGAAGEAWGHEGWRVPVRFARLETPLRVKDHMNELGPTLPPKYAPIQQSGDGNQGAYLAWVPPEMAQVILNLLGSQWTAPEAEELVSADPSDEIPEAEDVVSSEITNRTDIGPTERQQLVRARRGQGIYRKNLEQFETACRITGVTEVKHLRASHIKPWRASTDGEKLDGNNGLLLSPHVDHLFDKGFISFADDGRMLVSGAADPETLERWGLDPAGSYGAFRPEQVPYLQFHREFVFIVD